MISLINAYHLDLLIVGITGSAIGIMGFVVYLSNPKSITHRSFLIFALFTIAWNCSNFLQYKFSSIAATLFAMRFNLFIAVWHSLAFLSLALVFPMERFSFPRWYRFGAVPISVFVSILTLTPLVFSGINALAPAGFITNPDRGPGIILFSAITIGFLALGVYLLLVRAGNSAGEIQKQTRLVTIGMLITALLILTLSIVLPVFLNQLAFLPFAGLFMLPFLLVISYAIYQHKLFNIKVLAVETLVFAIGVITFIEVIFSSDPAVLALRAVFLILIVFAGILLTRSVTREVEQREKIQQLAGELEIANRQQESLIHFISHEVKGALGKCSGILSFILEGDYGPVSERLSDAAQHGLTHTREAVDMLTTILLSSNLKSGAMKFDMKPFSLKKATQNVVNSLKRDIETKHLKLNLQLSEGDCTVFGDENMLATHVIRNLMDNAIRYTPAGDINVRLVVGQDVATLSVKDSGIGLTDEDKKHLFTAGGRGKDSVKVNVSSTGYGLFFAKQLVEEHKGTIVANSEGRDKGSTFTVILPRATM